VGINTAMAAFAENIGFAVPINLAKDILPDLKEEGRVVRGFLGVWLGNIPAGAGEAYGLPDDKGALVTEVIPGSPAEQAGLETYDVITAVNRKKIESRDHLIDVITGFRPGTTVRMTYFRDKKKRTARVTLVESTEEKIEESQAVTTQPEETIGITVRDVTPDVAEQLGLEIDRGVIVVDVEAGSLADRDNVRPGDVILQVSRKPVKNVDLWQQLDEASRRHRIEWAWVRGHSGHPENERADAERVASFWAESGDTTTMASTPGTIQSPGSSKLCRLIKSFVAAVFSVVVPVNSVGMSAQSASSHASYAAFTAVTVYPAGTESST